MANVEQYFYNFEYTKYPSLFNNTCLSYFDLMIRLIDNILKGLSPNNDDFSQDCIKKLKTFNEEVNERFCRLLGHPSIVNENTLCEKVREFYRENIKTLVYLWGYLLVSVSKNLVRDITKLSKEECDLFFASNIAPFGKLEMKKEYILQILYNAYKNPNDERYNDIRKTDIYMTMFSYWIKLLWVLEIPKNIKSKSALMDDCKCKF